MKHYSTLDIMKGASIVMVSVMTLILVALLPQPGYQLSRLVFFALVILIGWIGAVGAYFERFVPTITGAVGVFLLGFWQFTIGLIMLPTSGVLLVTALLLREKAADRTGILTA